MLHWTCIKSLNEVKIYHNLLLLPNPLGHYKLFKNSPQNLSGDYVKAAIGYVRHLSTFQNFHTSAVLLRLKQ